MFVALFSAARRENCIFLFVNRSKRKANSANYNERGHTMGTVSRFGVSLKPETLDALDDYADKRGFQNRSQALTRIIEEALLQQAEIDDSNDVSGALVLIFDHHRPDFMKEFVAIQHDYQDSILASQHIHVDHHNCLETITMRGKPSVLNKLADRILALKGVKHGKLVFAAM